MSAAGIPPNSPIAQAASQEILPVQEGIHWWPPSPVQNDQLSLTKQPPSLRRRSTSLDHVLRDARLSDLETELEQLAMDARREDGVLGTHNTAEAISLRRTSELSLLFLRENHVPVIPISFRNGFLAFAPTIAGGWGGS